jgi:plasmid stabilization system protein ParE
MVMPVDYHALAQAKVRSVRRYYGRAGAGLSTRFLTALNDAIARVADNPSTWPRGTYGTRSCLLRKFPYRLVYVEQPTRVFVLAVAHNLRRPS